MKLRSGDTRTIGIIGTVGPVRQQFRIIRVPIVGTNPHSINGTKSLPKIEQHDLSLGSSALRSLNAQLALVADSKAITGC